MKKQELTVLKIEDLRPFPGNPFHLVEDEQLMELSESIKEFGMAAPILARPTDDKSGYEVISGQRRVRAAELAGIESVPAFVLPIDRDRAIITLVDSNIQRENILPSERAFAYKMKLDAMKRQGYCSAALAQRRFAGLGAGPCSQCWQDSAGISTSRHIPFSGSLYVPAAPL